MKNEKILLYGGKSTALIVYEMLIKKKKKVDYIFDEFIKKTHFVNNAAFSNKKKDLEFFIKNSNYFFVCIGMYDGRLRCIISDKIKKKKIKLLSIISPKALISKSAQYEDGFLAMPNAVVHEKTKIGNNCYLNVNAVVDHECVIGNGVHIMGSAYIAGRVKIHNYASIGANSTVLPDVTIGEGAIVGAGSVVTKDVKPYNVVVGNPAKFLRRNTKKYNTNIF